MKRLATIVVVALLVATPALADSTKLTGFAQCLANRGATMYSAWWCPYCLKQLRPIEPSLTKEDMRDREKMAREFPFVVECAGSTGESNGKCPESIKGFPAWKFSDGSELDGVQNFNTLLEKTGCLVPPPRMQLR